MPVKRSAITLSKYIYKKSDFLIIVALIDLALSISRHTITSFPGFPGGGGGGEVVG